MNRTIEIITLENRPNLTNNPGGTFFLNKFTLPNKPDGTTCIEILQWRVIHESFFSTCVLNFARTKYIYL